MHVKGLNHEFGVVAVAKKDYSDKAAWDYRSLLYRMEYRVDIHDDLPSHAAWKEGEPETGHYLTLEVSRDRIVGLLRELAAALNREYFIHLGI